MSEASRLRHGDAVNVSNEAQGIFLEQRRRSSLERLFRNSFLCLECFTMGESPVAVTLTSSNLNANEDGVIRFVVILQSIIVLRFYEHLRTSTADAPKQLLFSILVLILHDWHFM
jgi:hypothetical protein